MSEKFNFSNLLSKSEQQIMERPQDWRWISTLTKPDVKPIRHPQHMEWAKTHTHAPPQRELFITLAGKAVIVLNDKAYRTSPGVVMMFNSRERHDWDLAPWNSDFRHLWLHISTRHAVTSNLNAVDADGVRSDTLLKLMSGHNPQLLMELWDRCGDEATFSVIHWTFLKTLVATCFFESLSDWTHRSSTHPHQLIVDSIREHIHKSLDKELTLETLSRLAGYSPYFFHRLFLRYAEKPLHRYIVEAKLERAKELLEAGQSVTAVSDQVGMISPSYFSRFFKKHTRISPIRWREIHFVQK